MKNSQLNIQPAFNFDAAITASTSAKALTLSIAMRHIADRAHNKIDMMLQRGSLEETVSLVIKDEDKEMLVAALDANNTSLSSSQLAIITNTATMAIESNSKIYLSYQAVDQLFNAVAH